MILHEYLTSFQTSITIKTHLLIYLISITLSYRITADILHTAKITGWQRLLLDCFHHVMLFMFVCSVSSWMLCRFKSAAIMYSCSNRSKFLPLIIFPAVKSLSLHKNRNPKTTKSRSHDNRYRAKVCLQGISRHMSYHGNPWAESFWGTLCLSELKSLTLVSTAQLHVYVRYAVN